MQRTAGPILLFRGDNFFWLLVVLLLACGCATLRPNVELVLAREAFTAAKDAESARYAPGYYHKAEEAYRAGMKHYEDQEYAKAIEEFKNARLNAEKAENAARIQRQRSGEEGI